MMMAWKLRKTETHETHACGRDHPLTRMLDELEAFSEKRQSVSSPIKG